MACNCASHDDNATSLCVELQRLTTSIMVNTTPPDVLFLLDLQPARSVSVCTVRVVSNASNLNACLHSLILRILQVFRHSYDL